MAKTKLKEYSWWGFDPKTEPPKHLKTKKQLAELGLKPLKPVGVIHTPKYDCYLYNPRSKKSTAPKSKATPAQLAALAKGRKTARRKRFYRRYWGYCGTGWHLRNENYAIAWAREKLAEPESTIILDTETTDLDGEIVQIAVIDLTGRVLLDTLIKPKGKIYPEAIAIHGITEEMVKDAPTFAEIYEELRSLLLNKQILIYNAEFDTSVISYCCSLYKLPKLKLRKHTECLMEWYAQYFNDWHDYYENYRWLPLGGNHSALGDCQTALSCLNEMATRKFHDLKKTYLEKLENFERKDAD